MYILYIYIYTVYTHIYNDMSPITAFLSTVGRISSRIGYWGDWMYWGRGLGRKYVVTCYMQWLRGGLCSSFKNTSF